jgi:hypothetical protein
MVVSVRVRRGGLSLVLGTQGGKTFIGLSARHTAELPEVVTCSAVSLYNVLCGIECLAVDSSKQCLVRLQDNHVEVIWKRGATDTVFRLTVLEYKQILRSLNEGTREAA